MASPQLERGYVRVATDLFKAVYFKLKRIAHIRVALCVIRFTYGYNRKEFDTNVAALSQAVDYTPDYLREILADMEDHKILCITWSSVSKMTIGLNKNYDEWRVE